jgi:hypothetical protein
MSPSLPCQCRASAYVVKLKRNYKTLASKTLWLQFSAACYFKYELISVGGGGRECFQDMIIRCEMLRNSISV